MTARKAAHSLQRAKGALASGFATVDLHHATGHDHQWRSNLTQDSLRIHKPSACIRVFFDRGRPKADFYVDDATSSADWIREPESVKMLRD